MQPKTLAFVLLCALALGLPAGALAKAEEKDDKIVLENDHVTVWFQGKKPMLKVFPTANASDDESNVSGAYTYKITEIVEYRDLNGDFLPANNEIVARLQLDQASGWNVTTTEEEGASVLNLTMAAPVKMGPKPDGVPVPDAANNLTALPNRQANVSIVFTLRDESIRLAAGPANLTIPSTSVKYDLVVASWPFVDASANRLALVTQVSGDLDLVGEGAVETATVATNDTRVGVLSWTATAQGVGPAGAAVEVPVRTAFATDEGNATRIVHTYDAPGLASLVHDPTVGVTPEAAGLDANGAPLDQNEVKNKVPAPGIAVGLAAAGLAALALRRRKA